MLSIGKEIDVLLNECNESIAEIARRSQIDRSTLYKIVNGQRLPTAEQLEALMRCLRVTPDQRRTLLEAAETLHLSPEDRQQNDQIEALFSRASFTGPASISPPPDISAFRSGVHFGMSEISALLRAVLIHHAANSREVPVLISGGHLPVLIDCLRDVLGGGAFPVPVWQILYYARNTSDSLARLHNLQAFTDCVPLLLCSGIDHQARVCYQQTTAEVQAPILPHFLLLADCAVFLSEDGEQCLYETDVETVQLLRREFCKKFFSQSCMQALRRVENTKATRKQLAGSTALYAVRATPPVAELLPKDLLKSLATDPEGMVHGEFFRAPALSTDSVCYHFSETGLLQFVRTGRIPELPDGLYRPAPPHVRKAVLQSMTAAVRRGSPRLCMLIAPLWPDESNFYIDAFEGQGVLFGTSQAHSGGSVTYLLQEATITGIFAKYFSRLAVSNRAYDTDYLLHLIDALQSELT